MSAWSMKTVKCYEHSRGIYWLAKLIHNGKVVGTIEQMGRGGADEVVISDQFVTSLWREHCQLQGGEEQATYQLLLQEEGAVA